jgi:hypothetical protein
MAKVIPVEIPTVLTYMKQDTMTTAAVPVVTVTAGPTVARSVHATVLDVSNVAIRSVPGVRSTMLFTPSVMSMFPTPEATPGAVEFMSAAVTMSPVVFQGIVSP